MSDLNRFITEFCKWADADNMTSSSRSHFPSALRRAINELLPARDDFATVLARPLSDSKRIQINFDFGNSWIAPGSDDRLVAGVVMPMWRSSWRKVSDNEEVRDVIDFFFHFASQYIARSRISSMLGAIATVYDCSFDFRTDWIRSLRVEDNEVEAAKRRLAQELGMTIQSPEDPRRRKRLFSTWAQGLNCLDPFIHRAVYQFWRSTSLWESGFLEEATVALDSVVSIAAEFSQIRIQHTDSPRESLSTTLGVSEKDAEAIQHLYELRCDFGAHPSQSKWWDFAEIYGDDIHNLRATVKRVLWHLASAEADHRVVNPAPKKWSTWFRKHATMVLESVWFANVRSPISTY